MKHTKPETIHKADLAKLAGKSPAAVTKQLRRHGVRTRADGTVDKSAALEAMAAGAAFDKRRAAAEVETLTASGDTESLIVKSRMATLRRITLQGDLLQIEVDKARGALVAVDQAVDYVSGRDAAFAGRITTWREATAAMRPELRREIEALAVDLHARMAEPYVFPK